MPIDSSIPLGVKPVQIESPMNALAQFAQLQGAQQQNQLASMKMDEYQRSIADANSLRTGLAEPNADVGQVLLKLGKVKEYGEWQKTQSENAERAARTTKETSETENRTIAMYRDASHVITDPMSAAEFVKHMHTDPRLKDSAIARVPLEQALARIPQDPAKLDDWKREFALGATDFIKLNAPKTTVVPAGGTSQVLQTPGLGGAPQTVATIAHTQSPDNAASVAATLQGQALTDRRARDQLAQTARLHADTIANENLRAGVGPGGALDENAERTARAIATGQLPAPTGMALLNPKNQRILGRVMEINPEYDSTTVDAKKKAARDFTTGALGNSMRSFQVAGQHLDQLGELADALHNGNMQIVNKISNAYSSQTGNPAPTNFEAAKDVVSKEVVKAIVAGGGGVAERAELSHLLDNAKSPAQLKGVIQQYRNLMAAQHDALLQQRRAAGLSDTTLPNYTEPAGKGHAGTSGWSVIGVEPARK